MPRIPLWCVTGAVMVLGWIGHVTALEGQRCVDRWRDLNHLFRISDRMGDVADPPTRFPAEVFAVGKAITVEWVMAHVLVLDAIVMTRTCAATRVETVSRIDPKH